MSNTGKRSPAPISLGIRFFLGACICCMGIHFLVDDLAVFNGTAFIRQPAGKAVSARVADNDHQ